MYWLLRLIIFIVSAGVAIYLLVLFFRRQSAVGKVWKLKEPLFRNFIEEETGQKIRETVVLNASASGDFSQDSFTVWLAFTGDNMALIVKDSVLDADGDCVGLFRKDELSLRRKRLRMFELEFKTGEPDGSVANMILAIPKSKMEILRHQIKNIKDKDGRRLF